MADLQRHEGEMNAALAAGLPTDLPRSGIEVAMDFHDEPSYGKHAEARTYTCRDRAKDRTTRFVRIASAAVIWRGIRLTLAVTYVLFAQSGDEVLSTGPESDAGQSMGSAALAVISVTRTRATHRVGPRVPAQTLCCHAASCH